MFKKGDFSEYSLIGPAPGRQLKPLLKAHCPKNIPVIELEKTKAPAQRGYYLDQVVETPNQELRGYLSMRTSPGQGRLFCFFHFPHSALLLKYSGG